MERTFWQKLEGTTDQVIAQLRKLVEEGNIRRVVVKQKGKTKSARDDDTDSDSTTEEEEDEGEVSSKPVVIFSFFFSVRLNLF